MKMSENGLEFTAAWETFSAVPYYATAEEKRKGIRTIGFGHVIKPGETFTQLTRVQAMELLRRDIASAENAVNAVAGPLNQAQFDAMVDLVINVGPGAIGPNTGTGQALRAGDTATLAKKLPQFIYQGGKPVLGLRRRAAGRVALWEGKSAAEAEAIGRAVV